MPVNRRSLFAIVSACLLFFAAAPATALTADQARAHVEATIDDLLVLLRAPGSAESRSSELQAIMKKRGNLPQVAQFAAGRIWREMTPEQQKRYVDAFATFVSDTYSRRFSEYAGDPQISITRVIDAGRKGFLVETPVGEKGKKPISVSWLVSDRGGKVEIVDIVVEGISMAATEREQIAAMFQRHGQDVDALIKALAKG